MAISATGQTGTISSAAMTIIEYATMRNDPQVKEIARSLHQMGSALQDIKLQSYSSLRKRGFVWRDNLPTVNYTPLNVPPVVTVGKPTAIADQVYVVGNQFQVDEFYLEDENAVENPLDANIKIWLEAAFGFDFNNKFINNQHIPTAANAGTFDPNAWVGLQGRLGPTSGQTANSTNRYNVNTECLINGALTMTSGLTQANAEQTIQTVQQNLDYLADPDGTDCVLYCNDYWKRRFEQSIRTLGAGAGFDITRDAFDRPVEKYKNMTIRDLGRVAPTTGGVQYQRIVPPDETSTGTSAGTGAPSYTSFYIVRYGSDYFSGWQMRPLKPKYLGLDPTNGTMYNVVIRWAMGLWQQHSRSITRTYGCQLA